MKPRALTLALMTLCLIATPSQAADTAVLNEDCGVMVLNSRAALMYGNIKLPSPHWKNITLEEALVLLDRILEDTTRKSPSQVTRATSQNIDAKKVRVSVTEDRDTSLIEVLSIMAETSALKILASDTNIVFKPAR